ncbi:MAG: hypothetical protein RQ723_07015 [Desulfuromonadales bacterium]|nr:hypothetical protein [Desulfuromonadales bacterium]
MTRTLLLGPTLLLFTLAACAPVAYEPGYYRAYDPTPVYIATTPVHLQTTAVYRSGAPAVATIAITLYADRSYRGLTFSPRHLVLADGQYAAIPARDKKGRPATIYAHYHRQTLHFDTDRNCRTIPGAPVYRYDSRWDHGHSYSRLHAGSDFDLTGLRLDVRSVAAGTGHAGSHTVAPAVHRPAGQGRQPVTVTPPPAVVPVKPAVAVSTRHVTATPAVQGSRHEPAGRTQSRETVGRGTPSSSATGKATVTRSNLVRPAQPARAVQGKPVRSAINRPLVVKESPAKVAVPANRSRAVVSSVSGSGEKQGKVQIRGGQSAKPANIVSSAGTSQNVSAGKADGRELRGPEQKKERRKERAEGATTGMAAHSEETAPHLIADRPGEPGTRAGGVRRPDRSAR